MATESFFSNASLAYLASAGAGKDGKTYSIKPTDGSGDFTFSRGSNLAATRVGPTGLIEKGRENLLTRSNDFSDVLWVQASTTRTGGQIGYDGSSDAWEVVRASGGSLILYQSKSISGVNTFSVYVKINTSNGFGISFDSTSYAYFDISDDTRNFAVSTNAIVASSQEYIGNDFYKISVTASGSFSQVRFVNCTADGTLADAFGGTHIIQDAQLEIGLAATDYIESGATTGKAGLLEDEPRFDYSGGATCPSLLLEPSRTNIWPYSEYLDFGADTVTSVTITQNTTETLSPEGLYNATKLESSGPWIFRENIASTATGTWTISCYVKAVNASSNNTFRLSVGGNNLSSNLTATSEWQKFDFTFTDGGGSGTGFIRDSSSNNADLYIYGLQVEQGSYPTSYIPNHSGGSVTRGADSSDITSGISIGSGSEFGVYYEIDVDEIPRASSSPFIQIQFATASGGIGIKGASDALANFIDLYGTTDFSESFSALDMGSGIIKFFINYSSGTGDFYLKGTKYAGVISGPTSGCQIDSVYLVGSAYKLKAKQILLFPEALSDADCITLTTL